MHLRLLRVYCYEFFRLWNEVDLILLFEVKTGDYLLSTFGLFFVLSFFLPPKELLYFFMVFKLCACVVK